MAIIYSQDSTGNVLVLSNANARYPIQCGYVVTSDLNGQTLGSADFYFNSSATGSIKARLYTSTANITSIVATSTTTLDASTIGDGDWYSFEFPEGTTLSTGNVLACYTEDDMSYVFAHYGSTGTAAKVVVNTGGTLSNWADQPDGNYPASLVIYDTAGPAPSTSATRLPPPPIELVNF